MSWDDKFHGQQEVLRKFAYFPVTLRDKSTGELRTVWWEHYLVKVEYRTRYDFAAFLFYGKWERPLYCKQLHFM